MEYISDDKQTLQSDDAKTGKYEIMKTVVFKRANNLTDLILERGCSLQLYKLLIVWVLFLSVKRILIIKLSHD